MLTKTAFIIVFVLTLSLMVFPTSADQASITRHSPAEQKTQNANKEKTDPDTINHPAAPVPPVQKSYAAPRLQKDRGKGHHEEDNDNNTAWYDRIPANALLALFTFCLVVVGVLQFITLWRTLRVTTRSMQNAETAMLSTKRPFIVLQGINFKEERNKTIDGSLPDCKMAVWKLSPYWENNGDTATNVIISANCQIFPDKPPEDFRFLYVPETEDFFQYVCHKDIKRFIWPRTQIPNEPLLVAGKMERFDSVIDGGLHLFLWGEARYDDILDKKAFHHTRFCVELFFTRVSHHTELQSDNPYNYYTDYNHGD